MSTEYRQGIPSTAHVEAATRLGLLWGRRRGAADAGIASFRLESGNIVSVYGNRSEWQVTEVSRVRHSPTLPVELTLAYRPIRPDGTPVDWEVLDQEVARVGQQGQPRGFRADLWRRICRHFIGADPLYNQVTFDDIVSLNDTACHFTQFFWDWRDVPGASAAQTDILTRWTVYQELKPLYDLVDGAQGEAAMPRDVEAEWDRQAGFSHATPEGVWVLRRPSVPGYSDLEAYAPPDAAYHGRLYSQQGGTNHCTALRNFAAVLDAVAERRVAERIQGQTQAQTVTAAQPEQHRHNWIYDGLGGGHSGQYNHNCACGERDWFAEPMSAPSPREAVVRPAAQPEPRRFADVRPDRHGWRWWRIVGAPDAGIIGARFEAMREQWRWLAMSDGAAPTGNLIGSHSWTHSGVWDARTVIPTDEQGNPVSWEAIAPVGTVVQGEQRRDAATENEVQRVTQVVASITQQALQQILGSPVTVSPTTGHVEPPTAAPSRFALIEIDDADPTAKRIRQEQEAERHRLAELRQRLAAERAAQPAEETPETTSRFDLIEPDTQADPATSIRAWEARQAAAKVRPVAAPPRIAKPAAAPRRPAIEVVDAEVDGLSRSEVFAALFGRALNGGC